MGVHCKSILLLGTQIFFLTNGFQPAFCGKIFYAKIVPLGLFDRHSCYMSTKVCPIENNTNLNSIFYVTKSSKISFIFLPAFHLIIWLIASPKNFEKIANLKVWQLISLWCSKTHFRYKKCSLPIWLSNRLCPYKM